MPWFFSNSNFFGFISNMNPFIILNFFEDESKRKIFVNLDSVKLKYDPTFKLAGVIFLVLKY